MLGLTKRRSFGGPTLAARLTLACGLQVFLFQLQLPPGSTKKENAMTQQLLATQTRAGAFDTVAQADRAIRRLLAAGFSKDQLAVICPAKFKDHFLPEAPQAEAPLPTREVQSPRAALWGRRSAVWLWQRLSSPGAWQA